MAGDGRTAAIADEKDLLSLVFHPGKQLHQPLHGSCIIKLLLFAQIIYFYGMQALDQFLYVLLIHCSAVPSQGI